MKTLATGEIIAYCALASDKSLENALRGARQCFEAGDLKNLKPLEKASLLRRIATEIRKIADEGAERLCRESGKTLDDSKAEYIEAANYFDYYSRIADKIEGKSIHLRPGHDDYTVLDLHGI